MHPIIALLQQNRRSNSQSHYKDRSIMQEDKQAKVRDEHISRSMQIVWCSCADLPVVPQLHVAADLDPEHCWHAGGVVQVSPVPADVSQVQQCGQGVLYCAPAADVSEPVQNVVSTVCSEKPDTLIDHGTFVSKGLENKALRSFRTLGIAHPTIQHHNSANIKLTSKPLQNPALLHKYLHS